MLQLNLLLMLSSPDTECHQGKNHDISNVVFLKSRIVPATPEVHNIWLSEC